MAKSVTVIVRSPLSLAREKLETAESVAAHVLSMHRKEILDGLLCIEDSEDIRNEILDALIDWRDASNHFLSMVSKGKGK